MPETIQVGSLTLTNDQALTAIKELENQLGHAIDTSNGLRDALVGATQKTIEQRDAVAALERAFKSAEEAAGRGGGLVGHLRSLATLDVGATATRFSAAFAPVTQVISGVGGAVLGAGRALVAAGVQAEANERALRGLGGAYADVERATAGTVSATEALRAQQSLTQSGLQVTGDELAVITRRARDYALATGTETSQAIEQLTDALRGGEAEGLRRFGIAVQEGQTRTESFRQALGQFRGEQARTGVATRTLAEEQAMLSRGLSDLAGNAVNAAGRLLGVANALGTVNNAIQQANRFLSGQDARDQAGNQARNEGRVAAAEASAANARRFAGMFQAGEAAERFGDLSDDEFRGVQQARSPLEAFELADWQRATRANRARASQARDDMRQEQRELNGFYDEAVARSNRIATRRQQLLEAERGRQDDAQARRDLRAMGVHLSEGGGGGGEDPARAERERRLIGAETQRLARVERADEAANERIREDNEANRREAERRARLDREEANRRDDQDYAARQAADTGVQFRDQFASVAGGTVTAAQAMSRGVRGAFDAMTGAFRGHLQALIAGRESVGAALKGILQETLSNIAVESGVKALLYTAQGFAQLASYQVPAAAASFTAAGIYAATAAATGLGAYAVAQIPTGDARGAGPTAGAGPAGDGFARAGAGGGAGGGTTNVTTVNINGALATREDVQDVIRNANDGGYRRNQLTYADRVAARREAA